MNILTDFLDLIFPPTCLTCNNALLSAEDLICTGCRIELPKTHVHTSDDDLIAKRFYGRIAIKYTLAYLKFTKKGKVQRLVHALKYGNRPELGTMLGKWYGADLAESGYKKAFQVVIPVPLHPKKLKKRGYNQAEGYAKALAEELKAEFSTTSLIRNTHHSSQTRKQKFARWQNVEGNFSITQPERIKNKDILLVDDVVTTGATLEACAQVLKVAGCRSVSIATLAVAS